ncbi:MAG: hypothetical protein V1819_03335 [bacterium]
MTTRDLLEQIKTLQDQLTSLVQQMEGLQDYQEKQERKNSYQKRGGSLKNMPKIKMKEFGRGVKKIRININDNYLRKDVETLAKDLGNFKVEVMSGDIVRPVQVSVRKKSGEEIEKEKAEITFGTGCPIPDGFFDVAKYLLTFVFTWSLSHILEDLDDKVWEVIKIKVLNFYRLIAKSKKTQKQFVLISSYKIFEQDLPTIVFIFPQGLVDNVFLTELNQIAKLTEEVIKIYKTGEKQFSTYEYTYNIAKKKWQIRKIKVSNF